MLASPPCHSAGFEYQFSGSLCPIFYCSLHTQLLPFFSSVALLDLFLEIPEQYVARMLRTFETITNIAICR